MGFSLAPAAREAGHRLFAFDTVASTNVEALSRAREGEAGPAWFVSGHQTQGVGRRGASWQTPPGNLAATLLLTTALPPATIATLGFVAGVALVRALEACCSSSRPAFALKWPNDVLAGGGKVAGILLATEPLPAHMHAVAVGIGVNVAAAPVGLPYPASSLSALGLGTSAEDLFALLSAEWLAAERLWESGRGFAAIRAAWLASAAGVGGEVAVRTGERLTRGAFETIDHDGRLVVRASDGLAHRVSAGEVYFGGAATAPGAM